MPRLNAQSRQSCGSLRQQATASALWRLLLARLLLPPLRPSSRDSNTTSSSQRLPWLYLLLPSSALAFICMLEERNLELNQLPFCPSSTRTTIRTLNTFQTEFRKASSTACHSCQS